MALGGNLVVHVGANIAGLTKGMGKAGGIVGGFGSKLVGMSGIAAGLGTAIGGVVSAVKGIGAVSGAFTDIDRIVKSSRAFGITTEQMVGLEHAAELSGISIEKLSKGMQRATRQGTDLASIADKVAELPTAAEQAAFAYKELGRQGQDLIPLLQGGGKAIRDMMAEGEKLAGFSGIDAAKIEEANDAVSRMKLAFTGVARDIAIAVAPAVDRVAVGVRRVGEFIRSEIGPAIDSIKPYVVLAADIAIATSKWLFALRPIAPVIASIALAMKSIVIVQKSVAVGQAAILALSGPKGWATLAAAAAIGVAAYAGISRQFDSLTSSADTAVHAVSRVNTELANATSELTPAVASFNDYQSKLHDVYDEINALASGDSIERIRENLDISRQIKPFKLLGEGEVQKLKDALFQVRELKKQQADRVAAEAEAARLTEDRKIRAESLIESLKTPADKVEDRIAEIFELFQKDLLTLDQASALSAAARKELEPDKKTLIAQEGPAALQSGSAEAFSAVLAAMRGGDSPEDKLQETNEKQLAELQKVTRELRTANREPTIELVAGVV